MVTDWSVVPFAGRRESFMLAAGYTPALWPYRVHGLSEEELSVRVYVDVSTSTSELWSFLYGLVLHLDRCVARPIFKFSNAVTALPLRDLRQGRVATTGGTDFDCVIDHALRRKFRRILIVTDGEADLSPILSNALQERRMELYLVLTEENPGSPLVPLARAKWVIPAEAFMPEAR